MAALVLNVSESIHVTEEMRKKAKAIISDLLIRNVDLTQADFEQMLRASGAAGYEEFRSMIEGDYEYQKAIIKVIMNSSGNASPRSNVLKLTADLPDISDSGSATISAVNTRVNFTRTFTVPPEVVGTQVGGALIGSPRITSIDAAGFYIELVNAGNTLIAGTISWRALGY